MKKGLFIVIDGPSGSGKDSIITQVLKDLKILGIKSFSIEEAKDPTYDGKKILDAKQQGDKKIAETIVSERKKLYLTKIIPQLINNKLIIANRGETTTMAYQTIKQELTMEEVWNMHRLNNIPIPDLIVITNCSVEEAIRRESQRENKEEKNNNFMSGKFTDKKSFEKRKLIHANYEKVKEFLEQKEIPVIYLNTETMTIPQESQEILNFIKKNI